MQKQNSDSQDIPQNSENKPRGLSFSKALFERLIFGGAYIQRGLSTEGNLRFKIDLPFLLCFTLYLRAIFQVQAPGGLYLEGRFNGGFFCGTILGGLYLEGHIHGGAYFRNFTVYFRCQEGIKAQ